MEGGQRRRHSEVRSADTSHHRSNFPAKVSTVWDEYEPTISGPWLLFTRYIGRTRTTKVLGRSGNACGTTVSLVRYAPGGVAKVLHDYPAGTDVGYIYTDERTDGSLQVFFNQVSCRTDRSDIYKLIDSYTYSVSKTGSGTGTVTSDPAGIDCGTACQSFFHGGLLVTLTATPDSGSVFSGWSDSSCGMQRSCAVRLESDFSLSATFEPSP